MLIVFGADGNLGQGLTDILLEKNFDNILLTGINDIKKSLPANTGFRKVSDLSNEDEIIKIFSGIETSKQSLFFLFSTIGLFSGGKNIWEIDFNEWKKVFTVNLNISFLIAKHFARLVKESAGGSVCFVSALTSLHVESKKSAYGASKAALNYLIKTLAVEGKEINLSVNAIAPYMLDTEENRSWVKDKTNLIKLDEIGNLVNDLFVNYKIVSGNIIELPYNLAV